MGFCLSPILSILAISPRSTNLAIVGITLGVSFGGGLLINKRNEAHFAKGIFCRHDAAQSASQSDCRHITGSSDRATSPRYLGRLYFLYRVIGILVFTNQPKIDEKNCRKIL